MGAAIQGDRGLTGVKGIEGDKGFTGLKGYLGNTGIAGDKGYKGIRGFQGNRGSTKVLPDAIGERGSMGDEGQKGESGKICPEPVLKGRTIIGKAGMTGPGGDMGMKGEKGAIGPAGSNVGYIVLDLCWLMRFGVAGTRWTAGITRYARNSRH